MDRQTQIDLVEGIIGTIQRDMVENIKKGKVPEGWDGTEIRWWIKDKMKNAVQDDRAPSINQTRYTNYLNNRLIRGF